MDLKETEYECVGCIHLPQTVHNGWLFEHGNEPLGYIKTTR
jgi:hypothetical protein